MEGISGEALEMLRSYSWPGNVRELESLLERTMNVVEEKLIKLPSKRNRCFFKFRGTGFAAGCFTADEGQ